MYLIKRVFKENFDGFIIFLSPQIEGAFMQGLGLYTLEELKYSPSGLLYTRGPSQYKIPAVCDMPLEFNVYLLPDTDNPHAIYSSKVSAETISFSSLCSARSRTRDVSESAGYWRTGPLPGELLFLRHQRRGGGSAL